VYEYYVSLPPRKRRANAPVEDTLAFSTSRTYVRTYCSWASRPLQKVRSHNISIDNLG